MPDQKVLTEKESLEIISSMINKAKNSFAERGYLYLLWGWVILGCCITQFVLQHFFNYANASFVAPHLGGGNLSNHLPKEK